MTEEKKKVQSNNTAKLGIAQFVNTAKHLPSTTALMLRGETGVGKSAVLSMLGRFKGLNEQIDRRLSQMGEGDVIGLPDRGLDGETTRFLPPDWYMRACKAPVLLFLDEINRATPEVMQAAFQIVLDRELNGHRLHPNTVVVTAVNVGHKYSVNEIDPALLDRFWVIDLEPTVDEWISWGADKGPEGGNIDSVILDFISKHRQFLRPGRAADPGQKQPSQRSWKRLNDTLVVSGLVERPKDPAFYTVCLGYIGLEATVAFQDFAANIERISAEKVIDSLDYDAECRKQVAELPQERLLGLLEQVGALLNERERTYAANPVMEKKVVDDKEEDVKVPWTVTETQGENLRSFLYQLTNELRIKMWTLIAARGMDAIDLIKAVHPYIVQAILDVFGVKAGEKGTSQVPIIPGFLDSNATDKDAGKNVVSGVDPKLTRSGVSKKGRTKKSA